VIWPFDEIFTYPAIAMLLYNLIYVLLNIFYHTLLI